MMGRVVRDDCNFVTTLPNIEAGEGVNLIRLLKTWRRFKVAVRLAGEPLSRADRQLDDQVKIVKRYARF